MTETTDTVRLTVNVTAAARQALREVAAQTGDSVPDAASRALLFYDGVIEAVLAGEHRITLLLPFAGRHDMDVPLLLPIGQRQLERSRRRWMVAAYLATMTALTVTLLAMAGQLGL